ncbi:protein of unknown function [Taphrina deformans PYCC 5710]|uniref:Kinesin family protein n=1 Tax=Taphrina deformans (strain PYCC 5710 / ATCC 11124 / CBS 356.35 / IMI 108563 / JCM 9778 / NBRC 8474) TaxID=1097556 RepID=R4XIE5_TAPDE|nr:protein of unknown function [Taphrina deformans PYCC 5710]|eukprot:CCG84274.1 protein of unknown function [Taphrina deformans PYCC 5710]
MDGLVQLNWIYLCANFYGGRRMSGNITVAVRVRPLDARAQDDASVVEVQSDQIVLQRPIVRQRDGQIQQKLEPRIFKFDHAYDSIDHDSAHYADQTQVFTDLGFSLLDAAFEGYNCCIFAYGQTGSGKSYSMMGHKDDRGIIPQIFETLFARIAEVQERAEGLSCSVEVSYLEIYSEKVHDLLSSNGQRNLKVREHPVEGPYVEDLCVRIVHSYVEMEALIDLGNKQRTVAATSMNETSSRSHAVFMVVLKQKSITAGLQVEKVSKLSLVDLAGSERAQSTGATGLRLKEGAEINKSLSTLGRVISILAEQQSRRRSNLIAKVPYRDSTLTWLLKDSLGGNSLTAMLATISPSASNYEETLSTLRYADSAKKIRNHAVVNEDQNMKLIRELREEIQALRARIPGQSNTDSVSEGTFEEQMISITTTDGSVVQISKAEVVSRMNQSSKMMQDINSPRQEQTQQTRQSQQERERVLEELGIDMGNGLLGLSSPRKIPHLVNMSEDPLSTELLVYNLKRGQTTCGSIQSDAADIKLSSPSIRPLHCTFFNNVRTITLKPHENSTVCVNGQRIHDEIVLSTGCRLVIGDDERHIFRYVHPEQKRSMSVPQDTVACLTESRPRAQDTTSNQVGRTLVSEINLPKDNTTWQTASGALDDQQEPDSDVLSLLSTSSLLDSIRSHDLSATRDTSKYSKLEATSPVSASLFDSNVSYNSDDTYLSESDSLQRRKRASDTERLLQEFNASSLLSAVKEPMRKTSLVERLKAVQVNAQKELESSSRFRHNLSQSMRRSETQQLSLVSRVINKWYRVANIRMARTIFDQAHILKEAQILCLELKQNLNFQFAKTVADSTFISPLEEDDVFDLQSSNLAVSTKFGLPDIMVRVIDIDRGIILFWSLAKLKSRINRVKKHSLEHKSYHASKNLQLIERPLPTYSLAGLASIPVILTTNETTGLFDIDVYSPSTTTQIAVLSVKLKTKVMSNQAECMVELQIVAAKGLSGPDELTDVHVHAYFEANPEMRLTTPIAEVSGRDGIMFSSRHSCLLAVNQLPDVLCFELFGRAQSVLLEKIISWDNLQESHAATLPETTGSFCAVHNLICEIQICELDTSGTYTPCAVHSTELDDPGLCCLHQGLSRRLVFTFHCSKSHLLSIETFTISHVRSTAEKDTNTDPSEPVQLRILDVLEHTSENLVRITAQWDSSMHNTKLLDKTTRSEDIISVQVSMHLEFKDSGKRELVTRIPLRIQGREEQPGLFSRLFSASRSLDCYTTTFPIPLHAGEMSSTGKLANLSTARHYQNGQELLQGWQPRGISLIHNHEVMRKTRAASMALLRTKMMYTKEQLTVGTPKKLPSRDYIRDIIHYWQTQARRTRIDDLEDRVLASYPKSATSRVRSIDLGPTIKSGHLSVHEPSTQSDIKRFFTLRVPYLLQYTSATLAKLESVVDLSQSVVEDTSTTTFTVRHAGSEVSYIAQAEVVQREWITLISRI